MALLPDDFIEQVLSHVDIVDVVGGYVQLKKAGKDYTACCPFHSEKTPSFTVSPVKQFYHCFGCGAHGSAIGFVMQYSGVNFRDAVEGLASSVGLQMPAPTPPTRESAERKDKAQSLYAILARAAALFKRGLRGSPVAVKYAQGRGMTGEIAAHFHLGFASGDEKELMAEFEGVSTPLLVEAGLLAVDDETGETRPKFRQRFMFPIFDQRGNAIGFGGRVISDNAKPKYLNSPESSVFHKGLELYGLVQARQAISQSRQAVLLEGYMDVVMLHQHGEHRGVAALGTSLTADQVRRLYRMADEIIFCFDGDKAGRSASERAARIVLGELRDGKSARFVLLPDDHDPDSYVRAFGLDAWNQAIQEKGIKLSAKLIEMLTAGRDLTLPEDRAAAAKDAAELIAMISSDAPLFRKAMIGHVESVVKMSLGPVAPPAASAAAKAPPEEIPHGARPEREVVSRPAKSKWTLYYNLATLCALDFDAVERVPLEMLDDFDGWIIRWFSTAQDLDAQARSARFEEMAECDLKQAVAKGLERAALLRDAGGDERRQQVSALLDAFARVSGRAKRTADIGSLLK